jgi:outer membrane protein insertion porin family
LTLHVARFTLRARARVAWISSLAVCCLLWAAAGADAQAGQVVVAGQVIAEVVLEQEGKRVTDPTLLRLVETRVGEPLAVRAVTETMQHLMSLGRFDDVQQQTDVLANGVRVRYLLVPLHPVDRIAFRGSLGLSEGVLRRIVEDRFGRAPAASRQAEVADTLKTNYRQRGFPSASVSPRIEESHDPDRATLILDIDAGARAVIGGVQVIQVDQDEQGPVPFVPDVREGAPYDAADVDAALEEWVEQMHAGGFYEARASHGSLFPDGSAYLTINIARGPRVELVFAGDPLPAGDRDRLVPIRAEGSADEDLLEDSSRAIEDYLYARGYRDARASYTPVQKGGELTITFMVARGARYIVDDVRVSGHSAVTTAEINERLRLQPGRPFVQATLAAGVAAIQNLYRTRGFIRAAVKAATAVLPPENPNAPDREIDVTIAIDEGPSTVVRNVAFQGNSAVAEASLFALIDSAPGRMYSEADMVTDRDRVEIEYRNRGYDSVTVEADATLAENDTRADLVFTVSEGPQVIVDDIIIVGNERTSTRIIERELLLRAGAPLGYSDLIESRTRISALGLFRSVQIEPLGQPGATRRDVIVRVEEAPPTTIGGGGGLEGGFLTRRTDDGQAEERFELAPRGFFEIGRRNLWGKNRAVTLFTRVSLRSRDRTATDTAGVVTTTSDRAGLHEYRVLATFREPRIFDSAADVLFTASSEQAIRSSFDFSRRIARAEAGLRLSPTYSVAGRYSFEQTRLFNEDISFEERPLIDKLFPQVRLSKFSGSFIRDTRDDIIDATRGRFLIVDGDLAARAIGSEVGFVRTYVQGFSFHRLPAQRRMVVALAARLGAAHGFAREVPRVGADGGPELGPDGSPIVDIVQDLPASERFFAGGETTVRGFSLDRLGNEETISETGFPAGGNGVVVLNAELRVSLSTDFQAVGFLDAGNVFPRASSLDLTDLRPTPGFGLRYISPFGPVRVDLGFNVDRRELVPGRLERGYVIHVSLGQAF